MKKPWLLLFSETLTLTLARCSSSPSSCRRLFSSPSSAASIAVKRVTKLNFDSSLEDLRNHVRAADFVSVDLEMTGITSAPWRDSLEFDRSDVRYLKVKDSAEKFAIVQFGVCPFRWDPSKESFVAHPHNFYIFPRKELPCDAPLHEFLCQTTSLDFLAKYLFDFNACIHEGISYLSRIQEAEALHNLCSVYEGELLTSQCHLKDARELPLVSTFDILFTERMKNTLCEWRDRLLRNSNEGCHFEVNSGGSVPRLQTIFFKMRPSLMLNGFTSHQLRLIQLVVKKHFRDLVYVCVNSEKSSREKLIVYTDSEEDRDLLMKAVKEDTRKEIEEKVKAAVGFRHVIDLLSTEQKLIVGHSCFLDMAHIYSKFFGRLPSSIEEFASSIHKMFPSIVDTKRLLAVNHVAQNLLKRHSKSLSSAFAVLCPHIAFTSNSGGMPSLPCVNVEVQVDDTRLSNWNSGGKHEAGYDAFMTGCVFAQMCSHLGINFKSNSMPLKLAEDERLKKHINLLYLSWNSGDLIDLSAGTEILDSFQHPKKRYPKIVFENIVLMWGFSSKFKPGELRECFSKAFGPDSVTSIYFLDETAVFLQFSKTELVSDFLVLKEMLERRNDPISVLHPLVKLLEGGTTRASSYDMYKHICSSPISKVLFADQAEAVSIRLGTTKVDTRGELGTEESDGGSKNWLDNPNADSTEKTSTGKKSDVAKDCISREDVLESLYMTQSMVGKRMRTT